jgi:uncharacterized membrane protein YfcA
MLKHHAKKAVDATKKNNEDTARRDVLEELFHDFNRSRVQIYRMNFVRGIFFGLGSVIGGTIVVALIIWLMSLASGFFPPLSDFFNGVTETIQSKPR